MNQTSAVPEGSDVNLDFFEKKRRGYIGAERAQCSNINSEFMLKYRHL